MKLWGYLQASLFLVFLSPESYGRSFLIDFGTSASYRGVSVTNPDTNGRYWNGIKPGDYLALSDTANSNSTIFFGFNTNSTISSDSYNGPAGNTNTPTATEIANTKIDRVALGELGANAEVDRLWCAGNRDVDRGTCRDVVSGGWSFRVERARSCFGGRKRCPSECAVRCGGAGDRQCDGARKIARRRHGRAFASSEPLWRRNR